MRMPAAERPLLRLGELARSNPLQPFVKADALGMCLAKVATSGERQSCISSGQPCQPAPRPRPAKCSLSASKVAKLCNASPSAAQ